MRILREQTFAQSNILSHTNKFDLLNKLNKFLFCNKKLLGDMAELVDAPDSKLNVFPRTK